MPLFAELKRRNVFRVAIAYSVTAWLVAQVAELALESFGTPEWVMKTLLLLLTLGLPLAIIFAWAFEMTPEGLKREKDVDRSDSITRQTGRKLNYTIIGVLAVALVLSIATRDMKFGSDQSGDQVAQVTATKSPEKSIAVLPFVNMSDDKQNEYFSDGISEELLNVLVKVEGLRVASRTSSFSFKGKDTSIPEIAGALKVEHVLEGSVRKAGDTIRITAQLIDVRTDSHLWSETYDRKFEDIFVIQDEISRHIVEALKIALGTGEVTETGQRPTENLQAYEDYLKGRYLWQRRGEANIKNAILLFEKATAADPTFARAWSSLAAAHITLPTYASVSPEKHRRLALNCANRALELDSSIAEAHAVLGDISRLLYSEEWSKTAAHYKKAIELEPKNSTGYLWYAEFLQSSGRIDAALKNVQVALKLDPFNPGTASVAAAIYESHGRVDEARELLISATELGHPTALYERLILEIFHENYEVARQMISENLSGQEKLDFEMALSAHANISSRDAFVNEMRTRFPDFHLFLVADLAKFNRLDEAFELMESETIRGNDWFLFWQVNAAPLRADPRFASILEQVGLVEFWDKEGWSPLCERSDEQIICH